MKKKRRTLPVGVVEKNGRWYVRVRYREGGKRRAAWRECAKNATAAKDVRKALQRELEERGPHSMKHSNVTWLQLSQHFREHYLLPAKFVGDRLVSGYRSIKPVIVSLNALDAFFGNRPLRTITRGDLFTLKRVRLDTPVVIEKWQPDEKKKRAVKRTIERQRSITSVNKELRLARHLFNIAVDEGWLTRNPFKRNDRLISAADEPKRERIVTRAEEAALLAGCSTEERQELRRRIIVALDTGMRANEVRKLRAGDLDFENGIITVQASHTKTLTRRRVKMTTRVREELLAQSRKKKAGEHVFSNDSVRKSWTNLRQEVGLEDVRWHDLRHTNATRIERSQRVSAGQLQRHLGHSDRRSTERYVNQDEQAVEEIAEVLDEFQDESAIATVQ